MQLNLLRWCHLKNVCFLQGHGKSVQDKDKTEVTQIEVKFKMYLSSGRVWPRGPGGHRVLPLEESFPGERPESPQSGLRSLWGLGRPTQQRASRAGVLPGVTVHHAATHPQCQSGDALWQQHEYVEWSTVNRHDRRIHWCSRLTLVKCFFKTAPASRNSS